MYALLDDRFDELPNQTENKSLTAVKLVAILESHRHWSSSIFIMPKKIKSFSQTPSSTPRRTFTWVPHCSPA
ncbi:hypothetical protein TNCV_2085951 [Trichonephila clavipes]|nr:hypothetical protein TNCV_2085951 [Trichonephila clavipes]